MSSPRIVSSATFALISAENRFRSPVIGSVLLPGRTKLIRLSGKRGPLQYHVVVSTDGLPLAVMPSAANVHDTMLFPDFLRLAQVVCTAIGRLYADAGYDSADNRWLCLRDGVQPHIRKIGEPHGSGLGKVRCVVEHGCAWLLANKRLDRRQDRLGRIVLSLLTAAVIFIIANRLSAL